MRILIIEDEKLLADSLKALLEQNGFEADAACDGKTGEYYAALGIYDLLILDVMMPGRTCGRAFLWKYRSGLSQRHTGLWSGAYSAFLQRV